MSLLVRPVLNVGIALLVGGILAGCTMYKALPLDTTAALATDQGHLSAQTGTAGGVIDARRPINLSDFSVLALRNNPDLVSARDARGLARAQMLQAGVLPNPQLAGSLGVLIGGPASFDSWTAGFGQDIKSLVTLSAQRRGARLDSERVDADLLWQEWQVVGQARLLFVDSVEQARLARLLQEYRTLFAGRADRGHLALAAGDADLTTTVADQTALDDLDRQIADLERQRLARRHEVDALLGLAPDVSLPFVERLDLPAIDQDVVLQAVAALPTRRPDLVALRLGYASQEEKLRGAILAQFPALVFGGAGGSDTSHVLTVGPQITMDLPIFNHNQGNIAIERASRRKLRDEYHVRLNAATGQVLGLVQEQALLQGQFVKLHSELAAAADIASQAQRAFAAGNIDDRTYVDLQMARLGKQQQLIVTEQQMLEQQVAIATLTGAGMPHIALPTLSRSMDGDN